MIQYNNASLHQTAVHFVGNPSNDEPLKLSDSLLEIPDDNQESILHYLMRAFKPEAFYHFSTNGNIVHDAVKELFSEEGNFIEALDLIGTHEEKDQNRDLFIKMMRVSYKKSVIDMLDWSNEVAALGKEKQKTYLKYALHMFRQSLLKN